MVIQLAQAVRMGGGGDAGATPATPTLPTTGAGQ